MTRQFRLFLASALTLVLLAGCDSVVGLAGAPTGVALLSSSGGEVARYSTAGGGTSTGELRIGVGATARYQVVVLNALGVAVDVDGDEFAISSPALVIPRAANVSVQQPDILTVTGIEARTTTLRFTVRHNGSTAFIADDIALRVGS